MRHSQKRLPPFPRLAGQLHIFPALLPLAAVIPWLLTAVGVMASALQFSFLKRHRNKLIGIALVSFLTAGGVYLWAEAKRPSEVEGSRLLAEPDISKTTSSGTVVAYTPKTYDAFEQVWSVATQRESLAAPFISGDMFFVGTFDGTVDAHNRADGKLVWSMKKREPVFTNFAVHEKTGFIGEGLHTAPAAALTAFNIADGKIIWERQFRSHVESGATLDAKNDRLWTPAGEEGVWALDMDDGKVLWRKKVGHTDATPLYLDGKLYVSAQPDEKKPGAELSMLDPDDGDVKWKAQLPGNTMGSPQPGPKGVILLTTAIGQVGPATETDQGWSHAVSTDGKNMWTVKLPGMPLPEANVLADRGIVIHTLKSGDIIALNALDGSKLWEVKLGKEFLAPSSLRADTTPPLLASITKDGTVAILNAEDGTEIRRFNKKQGGYVAPIFDGDMLYVTTPRGISAYGGVGLLTRGGN